MLNENKMLDWISILIAFLLAVVIYTVVAKKTHMWPFDVPNDSPSPKPSDPQPVAPVVPFGPGPVIPSSAIKSSDGCASANDKMRGILLFVLIFVLLLMAIIVSDMVGKKKVYVVESDREMRDLFM